jgi:uracil-DNA glycosylase family 4
VGRADRPLEGVGMTDRQPSVWPVPIRPGPDTLAALGEEIVSCRACPRLVAWREQVAVDKRASYRHETYWARPVPGFGDPGARVAIVGLAPAAHGGNRTGRVFTGDRSADWLYAALYRSGYANQPGSTAVDDGLQLTDAWVTAAVRCAPPDNKPTVDERDRCVPFLERELTLLHNVRVVVVLGQFAYDIVCRLHGVRPRPRFGHGVEVSGVEVSGVEVSGVEVSGGPSVSSPFGGRTIVASYHPSQQNTFTGRLTEPMLDAVLARASVLSRPSRA